MYPGLYPGSGTWKPCDIRQALSLYNRSLSFFICKIGITQNLLHGVIVRIKWDNIGKAPATE